MGKKLFLGIDVGSVTAKLAVIDDNGQLLNSVYIRTEGQPIKAVQRGIRQIMDGLPGDSRIVGAGTTGSGRYLAGTIVGADVVKNEITSQAIATLHYIPEARTIIEIGGQDSKIIIIRDGIVKDFAMNTVCAAGTGSFLDHQAQRLNMSIEEFSRRASQSKRSVRIAGRCTVFAESDMVHKQQMGYPVEDIINGLCEALVRNYFSNVAPGKEILPAIVFQGGVAFNQAIVRAIQNHLGNKITVPVNHEVMGAIGAAFLAKEEMEQKDIASKFRGCLIGESDYHASSVECTACSKLCEISRISLNDEIIGRWGGRCDLWERAPARGIK